MKLDDDKFHEWLVVLPLLGLLVLIGFITVGAIRPGVGSGGVSRLFNAFTVGLRCGYLKGHSSSNAAAERSTGKAWRELTAVESVDPS